MKCYDVIGDIHGNAVMLERLLRKMGYECTASGAYLAPAGRQAVFLGDLIDRGPGQLRVLQIVRGMVESRNALCIAGNHEFNAVGYFTLAQDGSGQHLRPRSQANRNQHRAFLEAVGEDSALHEEWVNWFKTLPLALDLGGIRVAHADWNDKNVRLIDSVLWNSDKSAWSDEFIFQSYVKNSELNVARKMVTCGLEFALPDGDYIKGKEGKLHDDVRIARWRHNARFLMDLTLIPAGLEYKISNFELNGEIELAKPGGAPVFIGHHWFDGKPAIETPNLACLDWSAAKPGGKLAAYRWDGETELSNDKLVWVD